jgi:hypothetical protein
MERDDPVRNAEYLESLAAAVRKGIGYGIEVLAVGEERAGEVPLALIVQARCTSSAGTGVYSPRLAENHYRNPYIANNSGVTNFVHGIALQP